ncbi:ABC transporter ATP-binding protein [Paenibacillus sp. RS8]|uniref:ABC transporter ATP-binding protein n=1 Tax=Paenibacillus sp. RS8 TaxID=3242681 RepID=UPI0035C176E5
MRKIELKDVKKTFGRVDAINGLSLSIQAGDVYALLGHNGAGKTTTLRFLLGLLEPDEGEVSVFGCNPNLEGDTVRKMCGVLSEDVGLYEPLSVYDNLSYFAQIYGMKRSDYDKRIDELLSDFEILDKKHLPVKGFSTGMKKKVALTRALLHKPKILLLDEPTNGLDPVSIDHLRVMLHDLAQKYGTTIILTTHNLEEVKKICNKITIMRHGKNVYNNTMAALKEQAKSKVRIICNQDLSADLERLHKALSSLEINIEYKVQQNTIIVELTENIAISKLIKVLATLEIDVKNIETKGFDLEELYMQVENGEKPNE